MVGWMGGFAGPGGLGFLHTSPVHVVRFEAHLEALAPDLTLSHLVDESLLADALAHGIDARLEARVREAVLELAQSPASVVVCTCSTLGEVAERSARLVVPGRSFRVLRVDRPMAERAVRVGGTVGVVAALESALPHARRLLEAVAAERGVAVRVREFLCEGAWAHFEAGDPDAYAASVAAALPQLAEGVDVLMLAQASLEDALDLVPELPVPVLSSPRTAAEAAVAMHRELRGEAASPRPED